MADHVAADLHRAFPARLLTVTAHDTSARQYRRVWSSRPDIYPVPGTKPMTDEAWIAASSGGAVTLLVEGRKDFDALFPDAAVLRDMGCAAALTVPVLAEDGTVAGTVNVLDGEGWFTPARVDAIEAGVAARRSRLLQALSQS